MPEPREGQMSFPIQENAPVELPVAPKLEIKPPSIPENYAAIYMTTRPPGSGKDKNEKHVRIFKYEPTEENPHPNPHDLHGTATIMLIVHEDIAKRAKEEGKSFLYEDKKGFSGIVVKVSDPRDVSLLDAENPKEYFVHKGDIGQETKRQETARRKAPKQFRKLSRRDQGPPDELGRTDEFDPEYKIPAAFYSEEELEAIKNGR